MAQRRLLDSPQQRKARLQELLDRLNAGQHVQNRDIQKLLTEQQWQALERELAEARRSEPVAEGMPDCPRELDGYFELVDKGTLRYAMGERLAGKPSSHVHYRASETLFAQATERLAEAIGAASHAEREAMLHWLDRPLTYSETGEVDLGSSPSAMPRKVGSRSKYTLVRELPNRTTSYDMVRRAKQMHLSKALDELNGGLVRGMDNEAMAKLRSLTKLVRR